MAIIKNPLTIVQTSGESQVPEYMSAKNFTFNGNTCTGYVGDNSFPEIIIPKSYSIKTELVDSDGMLVTNIYNCSDVLRFASIISATFTDGVNTEIFNSSTIDSLPDTFQGTCYLTELVCTSSFELAKIINQSKMFLQYPITINGNQFASTNEASSYISTNNINTAIFAGQVEQISYIDGNDYQVTRVSSIEATVSGFKNYKNRVILLSNITTIDSWAFQDCTNLTSIEIPNSVTNIGVQVFSGCRNLINVVLPEGITKISTNEFSFCSSLISINIPSSVTIIGVSAFSGCSSLTTITIPETVTSIESSAFRQCSSLTTITIPESVTSIGVYAFVYCRSLENVIYEGQAPNIQNSCFQNCTSITKYDFRNCTTVPTLANVNSLGHATGCQIIIPDALYDDWTTATNWVSLTGVTFVKASEYTE